jgi:hypothetical protein
MMLRGGKGSRSREMKRHERRKELNAVSMMLRRGLLNVSIVMWRRKRFLPGKLIYNILSSMC